MDAWIAEFVNSNFLVSFLTLWTLFILRRQNSMAVLFSLRQERKDFFDRCIKALSDLMQPSRHAPHGHQDEQLLSEPLLDPKTLDQDAAYLLSHSDYEDFHRIITTKLVTLSKKKPPSKKKFFSSLTVTPMVSPKHNLAVTETPHPARIHRDHLASSEEFKFLEGLKSKYLSPERIEHPWRSQMRTTWEEVEHHLHKKEEKHLRRRRRFFRF